ncbi:chorismate synthase [Facklamia lactis]|uniref:chorismate synthase n=1 Tax=Facklamia lactis TaxID=2749967 RepID=UPI0018CC9C24|nr:chorismate synthase [Facklamia lactis]MBG9979561.1 chorismate synthase [Facklamia lactis]
MSFSIGQNFRLTVYGQSHAAAIGVIIDGLPAGINFPHQAIQSALERRRPGKQTWTSRRSESDLFEIKSGIVAGKTCGAPICLEIVNHDKRSKDYAQHDHLPRPSHADYPAYVKYQGHHDIRGGGHFSGRMTAPIVMAGSLANNLLIEEGIHINSHIYAISDIKDQTIDPVQPDLDSLAQIKEKNFPVLNDDQGLAMQAAILAAKEEKDSVGGQVETVVTGLPVGLGQPLYDSCEAKLAHAMFGIPAIRGIEFGTGFAASLMRGSQHNDPYYLDTDQTIKTSTNHHGGVIGGLTTGMPLIMRVAIKPTSSIGQSQQTVNLDQSCHQELTIQGRHDPCIVPRVVPVIESMTAICLLDLLIMAGKFPV